MDHLEYPDYILPVSGASAKLKEQRAYDPNKTIDKEHWYANGTCI